MPILVRVAVGLFMAALMMNCTFDVLFQFVHASHAAEFMQLVQQSNVQWIDPAGCRTLILVVIIFSYLAAGLIAAELISYAVCSMYELIGGVAAGVFSAVRWLGRRVGNNLAVHVRGWRIF